MLILALAVALRVPEAVAARRLALLAGVVGALLGWAVTTEFIAAPAVGCVGFYMLWKLRRRSYRELMIAYVSAGAGGLLAMTPLFLYHTTAFGGPLSTGYANVVGLEGMRQGLFGISQPRPAIALRLLVGRYRGLLWVAPILGLWPIAFVACMWRRRFASLAALSLAVLAAYLLINAGYAYWHGGSSTGPRHLVPALPFLSIPLMVLFERSGRVTRPILCTLLAASVTAGALVALTTPYSPQPVYRPLTELLIPMAAVGDFSTPFLLLGQRGHLTLIPLALVWLAGGALLGRRLAPRTGAPA